MNDNSHTGTFLEWIRGWDFYAILYSLLAAFIFAMLLGWRRFYTSLSSRIRNVLALRRYTKALQYECMHLITVGKRQGLSMDQAFVHLDVVTSDLMRAATEDDRLGVGVGSRIASTCVLIGGPGAGKSTLVKRHVLNTLRRRRKPLPLLVRLRNYVGFSTMEDAIVHELTQAGFVSPDRLLQDILQQSGLCVLDGLDEVKPSIRAKVLDDINVFYHKYYAKRGTMIVTCRREAYLDTPLDIPIILEVRPLRDEQIQEFADKWPLGYPRDKSAASFWRDLTATPRIHELARSPLLLVGGLMQYTESNSGVPDERFKYLERVANWLITDWATAQGHPPDPFRPLYDRVLPKLAFEMQKRKSAEIEVGNAEDLMRKLLPTFGCPPEMTADFLASLRMRTGIVVADDKHHLVFAQFGLQEYFASLEINLTVGAKTVAALEPRTWWREPILLAVAQQRDPNPYLEALYEVDPILSAAAIAECPTPSLDQQTKAVTICIREVDATNDGIKTPVVQLLRKLDGKAEDELVNQLERRLTAKSKVAQFVGLVLATAGTTKANETLSKHPEVWATCLSDAGFLSDSFEGLLFNWVQQGDDKQCFRATDALFENLQERNVYRLLSLLPSLSHNKADYVAQRVLSLMLDVRRQHRSGPIPFMADIAVSCVPYVRKPERFLSRHLTEENPRKSAPRAFSMRDFYGTPLAFIGTLFFLCKRNIAANAEQIRESISVSLSRSREACQQFPLLLSIGASAFAMLALSAHESSAMSLCSLSAFIFLLIAVSKKIPQEPWSEPKSLRRSVTFLTTLLFAVCCISLVFLVIETPGYRSVPKILSFMVPLTMFLLGVSITDNSVSVHDEIYGLRRRFTLSSYANREYARYRHFALHEIISADYYGLKRPMIQSRSRLYCAIIVLVSAICPFLVDEIAAQQIWLLSGLVLLTWATTVLCLGIFGYRAVAVAAQKAAAFLKVEVKNM